MKKIHGQNTQNTVPAVCTAIDILRALVGKKNETTTKALAIQLGIPRTTCYRILQSLILKNCVRSLEDGGHELSVGLLPLLEPLWQVGKIANAVSLALDALVRTSRMTAKVAIRQGDYAVTVSCRESPEPSSITVRVGAVFHLAYGSTGAVLLGTSAQDEIQRILNRAPEECWIYQKPEDALRRIKEFGTQGWCADTGLYHPSFHSVSMPLHNKNKAVIAVITVLGFPHELPSTKVGEVVKMLTVAVRQAERELSKMDSAE